MPVKHSRKSNICLKVPKEDFAGYLEWKTADGQARLAVNHLLTVKTYCTSRILGRSPTLHSFESRRAAGLKRIDL